MMKVWILCFLLLLSSNLFSQQVSDTTYNPPIPDPAYSAGKGPVVFIDEGHNNFHTKDGRYKPFSNLLVRDGYTVKEYPGMFEAGRLSEGKILVISNALNEINIQNWYLPTPSAFTQSEIEQVKTWVHEGGSLFLIADHMPMAGAASELAAAFGFEFSNGFVLHPVSGGTAHFNIKEKTLAENTITLGRNEWEKVTQVVSFTGQGFRIPDEAASILTFGENHENYLPDTAWVINEKTPRSNIKGWSQGAYRTFGKGRVVVSGEAAMFTAQLAGPQSIRVGMNQSEAVQNHQLLLNIIHWLDGKL